MYHYGIERKEDAIRHATRQPQAVIRCGEALTLSWDDIYGVINERIAGALVARHVPTLDATTGEIVGWRQYGPDLTQGPQD